MRTIGNLTISGSLITSGSITATTFIGVVSSSAQLSTEISGAFTSTSASLASDIQNNDTRLSTLEGKTLVSSSAQISYTGITDIPNGIVSSSAQLSITESQISDLTHYTNSDTLNYINSIGVVSGSVNWDTLSGIPSGIISSSAQLSNQTVPGNFTVGGILTAQEFHTEFVSASIIYQSGSTQFGNSIDDTHNFIGTVSASNFAGDGSQLTSVLSMNQENFTLGSSTNSITVTSGSLPSSNDKILIYYNGQFINKTYISSKTTDTINLTFSASLGDQIDVVWYNFN